MDTNKKHPNRQSSHANWSKSIKNARANGTNSLSSLLYNAFGIVIMVDNHATMKYVSNVINCGLYAETQCAQIVKHEKANRIFTWRIFDFDVLLLPLHRKALSSALSHKSIIIGNVAVNVLPCHVMPIHRFHFPSHNIQCLCKSPEHRFTFVGRSVSMSTHCMALAHHHFHLNGRFLSDYRHIIPCWW